MDLLCDWKFSITVAPELSTGWITVCDDDTDADEPIDDCNAVDLVVIVVDVLVVWTTDIRRTGVSSNRIYK